MNSKSYLQRFDESWIFEMPQGTGKSGHNPYPELLLVVKSNIDNGATPENLGNGLFRLIIDHDDVYFWIENSGQIEIIARLSQFTKGLAIELIGKKPGANAYASDFYKSILKSIPGSLLFSGNLLSDEGLFVWSRLLNSGVTIMVYDPANTQSFQNIADSDELKKFIGSTENYQQYRFVLSANKQIHETVKSEFELLRAYKLTFNIKD